MKSSPETLHSLSGLLRSRFLHSVLGALVALGAASALPAAPGVVQTRAGRILEGDIRLESEAGLAVVSASGAVVVRVPFEDLQEMKLGAGASAKSLAANTPLPAEGLIKLGPLPASWQQAEIGAPRAPGNAGRLGEVIAVRAAGTNLWSGGRDEGHFVYQKLVGNGSIVARLDRTDARFAGLMVRKDLAPDAEFVLVAMEGAGGRGGVTYCTRRSAEFREKFHAEGDRQHRDEPRTPLWLRIDREGKKFTGYISRDEGAHWEFLATSHGRQAEAVMAGLFVCGGEAETAREAAFSQMAIGAGKIEPKEGRFGASVKALKAAGQAADPSFQPQVVLRNGSVLTGKIVAIDPSGVRQITLGQEQFFSSVQVARVLFRPVPLHASALLAPDRPGVLMSGGDFFEGEITAVKNNSLYISSVVLGQRKIDLGDKVIAVVWNDPKPAPGGFLVRLRDGSVLRARSLGADGQAILAHEAMPAVTRVPLTAVLEIQRD
jgi:hypothetical protein